MLKKESVRPCDEALLCYVQDKNIFRGAEDVDHHSNTSSKTLYHVATRSEKNLSHDYTIRHNEVRYDLLANELDLIYKLTYAKRLQIPRNIEAYIQSIVLKETPGLNAEKSWKRASFRTTSKPFKAMNNDENGVKHDNMKNIAPPIILDGEDSDLEEEKEAVKMCSNYDMSLCIDAKSYNSNDSE
ncbi:hypothetical protein CWI38_0240p0030 [Hamiltosporidium tvaerminnensis]|uniref:Uncharacterized protein n=1 Tax=Hamiltosporidium tvaerminnensis TaxID=1176355 RepID=A0A4V2JY41_9MICR|nr:hypothetical protein CWI38_0240p0030 [Hamiltosporidium tvaerminnensis]